MMQHQGASEVVTLTKNYAYAIIYHCSKLPDKGRVTKETLSVNSRREKEDPVVSRRLFLTCFGITMIAIGTLISLVVHYGVTGGATVTVGMVQPSASSVPADKASQPVHTAPSSVPTPFTGNPFDGPKTFHNQFGDNTTYACAKGLNEIDLPVGKSYSVPGAQIGVNENRISGYQDGVMITIKLDKTASMPGMIIHSVGGAEDSMYRGVQFDHTYVTWLTAGTNASIPLTTADYVPYLYLDSIISVSFCLNK